jgi:hypothetical protein
VTNADVPLVELRRYALHPGTRDEMLGIFERELMEGQEAAGMRLLGQFRDLDDPDAFVWLRGFRDMASRYTALWDFYTGPVWKNHQEAVNATMISSDDVLLLRPHGPDGHLPAMTAARPPREAITPPGGLVVATTYPVADRTRPPPGSPPRWGRRRSRGASSPIPRRTRTSGCRCGRTRRCSSPSPGSPTSGRTRRSGPGRRRGSRPTSPARCTPPG